jgi:uncharacterized protein YjbI with pentapeptide repeats
LNNIDLRSLYAPAANFDSATMQGVQLNGARLVGASFRKSKLTGVDFTNAGLETAGFAEATISGDTKFNKADLLRASFDGAQISDGVDFSGARVRQASFKGVAFSLGLMQRFKGTAWWLIKDLTVDQIKKFDAALGHDEQPTALPGFNDDFRAAQTKITQSEDKYSRALWLNEAAWTLAIYGADEQVFAGAETNGVALAQNSRQELADYQSVQADVSDTLAYLLMQRAERAERAGDANLKHQYLQQAIEFSKAAAATGKGEFLFRYALALNALGKADAMQNLGKAIKDKGYVPTHELFLLDAFISPDFWDELKQAGIATR